MDKKYRVGTRKSRLAISQTKWVLNEINKKFPYMEFEIVGITTKGDRILDTRLDKIGGKGLFIKEIENALIEEDIDFAVHSLKDMPPDIPQGLEICSVSKREDPRDVILTYDRGCFEELGNGAVIGTSSIRREIQIGDLKKDVVFKTLRGNVNTRLRKLYEKEYNGIVLAAAGLNRLGFSEKSFSDFLKSELTELNIEDLELFKVRHFSVEEVIPSVCQGILAIESRKGEDMDFIKESIHCGIACSVSIAERSFMKRLKGGCTTPMAAHGVVCGERLKLCGMLGKEDKSVMVKGVVEGWKNEGKELGERLADQLSDMLRNE